MPQKIMRHNWHLLILVLLLVSACKEKTIDFTYSPLQPKAGEKITFTNACDFGEEWAWSFGDNTFSTLKSPTHIYRKPGKYTLQLMVDSTSRYVTTKTIEVYDTIPSFTCDEDTILYFRTVKFRASVWNPFKYTITYLWHLPDEAVLVSESPDKETVEVFFTTFGDSVPMSLTITINDLDVLATKRFYINGRPSERILTRTAEADYGQRLFGELFETARPVTDSSAVATLNAAQDSVAQYGAQTFTRHSLPVAGHTDVEGFVIDAAARKIYLRDNGVWVANINGSNLVLLDSRPATALAIGQGALWYASTDGVYRLPLLQTPDNSSEAVPEQVNTLIGVQRLAVDATKR